MNKTKIAKIVVKTGLGFAISAAIGYAIKAQKHLDAKIDAYGATPKVEVTVEV